MIAPGLFPSPRAISPCAEGGRLGVYAKSMQLAVENVGKVVFQPFDSYREIALSMAGNDVNRKLGTEKNSRTSASVREKLRRYELVCVSGNSFFQRDPRCHWSRAQVGQDANQGVIRHAHLGEQEVVFGSNATSSKRGPGARTEKSTRKSARLNRDR